MRRTLVIAATTLALLSPMPAVAQPAPHQAEVLMSPYGGIIPVADNGRGRGRGQGQRNEGRGRAERPERGPPPGRSWDRGQYLPPEGRGAQIRDFDRYRLRPPPPGYDWVQVGRDIYLTQRSTGLVLDAIPGQR